MHSRVKTDAICCILNKKARSWRLLQQAVFTAKNSISDQDKWYGRRVVSAEHLHMLQASVIGGSATQPQEEAIPLAASDTAVYKVFFHNNLFKLQSLLWMSLLEANLLNMSILTGYPASPCPRPKTQHFWETTYLHFLNLSRNRAGLS